MHACLYILMTWLYDCTQTKRKLGKMFVYIVQYLPKEWKWSRHHPVKEKRSIRTMNNNITKLINLTAFTAITKLLASFILIQARELSTENKAIIFKVKKLLTQKTGRKHVP